MPSRTTRPGAITLLAGAALLWLAAAAQAATFVYVANADSQDISVLELDRAQGLLKPVDTVAVAGTVMPMAVSPDKRFLYAALRSQPFRVASFAIDGASGRLRKLGEAPLADSMANIDVDASGRWLFAASYPGHKITVNSIGQDGAVGAVQQLIPTAPNAHAIHADATNRFVLGDQPGWRQPLGLAPRCREGGAYIKRSGAGRGGAEVGAAAFCLGPGTALPLPGERSRRLVVRLCLGRRARDAARAAADHDPAGRLHRQALGGGPAPDARRQAPLCVRAHQQHAVGVPGRPRQRPAAAARPDADRKDAARVRHRFDRPLAGGRRAGLPQRVGARDRCGDRRAAAPKRLAVGKNPNWIQIVDLP